MARIFISYQRSDTLLLAHCLRYAISAAGHEPFVDTGAIPAAAAFVPFIDGSLAQADLVVVLIGPSFDFERLNRWNCAVGFEWRRAKFHGCAVLPVIYRTRSMVRADRLPADLRWLCARNARFVSDESLSSEIDAIVAAIPALARPPRPSAHVLWIDDMPKNNELERRTLRESGVSFDNVVSTLEAVEQLRNSSYDLVITDLSRSGITETSAVAGLEALELVLAEGGPPVIVYAGRNAVTARAEILHLGGFGSTNDPRELYELVDRALGRTVPDAAEFDR